jgi:hypothetical protein
MAETPTPTPSAVPVDVLPSLSSVSSNTVIVYVLVGAIVMAAALLMALALNNAAKRPPPAALITALSMLTLFAVAGGIATNNDEAWTIAAAGVGALAGSVTALFQEERYRPFRDEVLKQRIEADAEEENEDHDSA